MRCRLKPPAGVTRRVRHGTLRVLIRLVGRRGVVGCGRPCRLRFDEVADEGLFQVLAPASQPVRRGGRCRAPARMHHRHAVAAPTASFMKWVEMKTVTPRRDSSMSSRQNGRARPGPRPESARPESKVRAGAPWPPPATGAGACPEADWLGQVVDDVHQPKALHHPRRGAGMSSAGTEQPACNQVLAYRDFAVERERLGHVSTRRRVPRSSRVHFMAEQPGRPSLAGNRPVSIFIVVDLPHPLEPRTEDFTAPDAEGDMFDGGSRQSAWSALGLDGDVVRAAISGGMTTGWCPRFFSSGAGG